MLQDDDLLQEFVVESAEHLSDVEGQLLEIESGGADINVDLVNTVFRAVHSVKGAAGFLGLVNINLLAHNLENVLNLIRNREMVPTKPVVDALLRSADMLRTMVEDVDSSNEVNVTPFVAEMKAVLRGDMGDEPQVKEIAETMVDVAETVTTAAHPEIASPETAAEVAPQETPNQETPAAAQSAAEPTAATSQPAPTSPASAAPVPSRPASQPSQNKQVESSVRVNVSILDRLMNLAGELVLGRNQLLQTVNNSTQDKLENVAGRLDQVTSELQEAIMQTRMQPVGSVFNRFPRVVRDLSSKLAKECALEIEGSDVEVDKTIVEAIGDPLTHLVRNSVDHGIEKPEIRVAAGKPSEGTIRLRAFHQAGKVCIRIEDNGGGIDPEKIKSKAVSNGLISESEAATMSTNDALRLIFAPGFSTAAEVTDVSGRGVGMDVVKTNIEQIGGTVDIESELGVGSAMHITLPLTLAIIPSMIVGCGDERFAIPQTNIAELVRVPLAEFNERIGNVQGAEVLRLRGALLPLVRLNQVFGIDGETQESANEPSTLNIVVVESGQFRYGVAVDRLFDSEEIVVKPLGKQLKELDYLAGATILGDGRVALIIDVSGIASEANLRSCEELNAGKGDHIDLHANSEVHRMLLFDNAPGEHFAVPMACVSRIERTEAANIINLGKESLLSYRGGTLPLLSIERLISAKPRREDLSHIFVIVFSIGKREIGLLAPELNDICNVALDIDDAALREPGVAGVVVVNDQPTRMLDLVELTKSSHPEWIEKDKNEPQADGKHILIAEDSAFFRRHVEQTLVEEGYTVTTAVDGQDGWEKLQEMRPLPTLVVTDVEMPRMSGLDFCKQIRADSTYERLPVIALTSLASDDDVARGKGVGIDDYQVKLDKSNLLDAIARYAAQGR